MISAESSSIVLRCSMAARRISAKAAGSASAMGVHDLKDRGEHDAAGSQPLLQLEHLLLQLAGALASLESQDERGIDAGRAQRLHQK
ncbi:hypothetical protein [Bradyrhizobium elkanii]|uniref:hypothetical protein n=1 Tax=Bradyrhizobium elkanii TaxID=29448 RepID=UPI003513AAEA